MDSTILTDPFVWVCNDVIPNNKCREIINRFEADNKHHQGATCDGVDLSVKNIEITNFLHTTPDTNMNDGYGAIL